MPEVPHHHGAGLHDAAPGQSQHAASHVSLQHLQSDANLRAAAAGGVGRDLGVKPGYPLWAADRVAARQALSKVRTGNGHSTTLTQCRVQYRVRGFIFPPGKPRHVSNHHLQEMVKRCLVYCRSFENLSSLSFDAFVRLVYPVI